MWRWNSGRSLLLKQDGCVHHCVQDVIPRTSVLTPLFRAVEVFLLIPPSDKDTVHCGGGLQITILVKIQEHLNRPQIPFLRQATDTHSQLYNACGGHSLLFHKRFPNFWEGHRYAMTPQLVEEKIILYKIISLITSQVNSVQALHCVEQESSPLLQSSLGIPAGNAQ